MTISGYNIPAPASGELLLTINLHENDMDYLLEEKYGKELFSRDEQGLPDELVNENILHLYKTVNIELPDKFTSLEIRQTLIIKTFLVMGKLL